MVNYIRRFVICIRRFLVTFMIDKFKEIIRHTLPPVLYAPFLSWRRNRSPWRLTCLRLRSLWTPRHRPGRILIDGLQINYADILSLYMEYKDIFVQGIYYFKAKNANPYIIDGGGCIGMSVLYSIEKTWLCEPGQSS